MVNSEGQRFTRMYDENIDTELANQNAAISAQEESIGTKKGNRHAEITQEREKAEAIRAKKNAALRDREGLQCADPHADLVNVAVAQKTRSRSFDLTENEKPRIASEEANGYGSTAGCEYQCAEYECSNYETSEYKSIYE